MIPNNIQRNHILSAIKEIDKNGVPNRRNATKYLLRYNGETFPPKYVISLANKFANGTMLETQSFNGGREVNDFLCSRGFEISPTNELCPSQTQTINNKKTIKHDEHCSECKKVITEMFRCLYGEVKIDHKILVPTKLDDYSGKPVHKHLQKILKYLESYRENKNFIKMRNSLRCDMFVPALNAVIELDESQHFTQARKIALSHYPSNLKQGFDLDSWKNLCDTIDAKDNDPKYRDEQRAWYDTIRDFLPIISGLDPTIRIRMGDYKWCSLNPKEPHDVNTFQNKVPALTFYKSTKEKNLENSTFIATVNICSCSKTKYTKKARTELLKKVLIKLDSTPNAIVFPAGFYKDKQNATKVIETYAVPVIEILRDQNSNTVVCFGIDGRETKDQIAVAVTKESIIGVGRKFHQSPGEENIELATPYTDGDSQYGRIININGKNAFLAVCYDIFGIRQKHLPNPGVQLIFNLVHKFMPHGTEGGGDVNFARHGFAGASQQWNCPVFGAAVFFDREIPETWPTGVNWNPNEETSTREFYYENNTLVVPELSVRVDNDDEEYASIRTYKI